MPRLTVKDAQYQRAGRQLNAIDLFAGAGGLTVGLNQAGFDVIGAVELDETAAETYRANHPHVKLWNQDITHLEPKQVMEYLSLSKGDLDLLAGCPPCQGFSTMRTLNGARQINDDRNDLVFSFLHFATEMRPKSIMLENVPGLGTNERFRTFLCELRSLGYYVDEAFKIVNAVDHGVPQNRRRLILMTSLVAPVQFPKSDPNRRTVGDALAGLPPPGTSGDLLHDLPDRRSEKVLALIRSIPKDGGSRSDLGAENQLECHKKCNGFSDVYGRMALMKPSPTITSGCNNPSKGRFIHPVEHRAITLREAALLQTFPVGYKFSLKRGKAGVALMIGNALPPELIKRHALKIKETLKSSF